MSAPRISNLQKLGVCILLGCSAGGGSSSSADTTATVEPTGFSYDADSAGLVLRFGAEAVGGELAIEQGEQTIAIPITQAELHVPGDVAFVAVNGLVVGEATWRITKDGSPDQTGTVQIGERFTTFFDTTRAQGITVTGLPARVAVGTEITVTGTSGAEGILGEISVGAPSGPVSKIRIGTGGSVAANSPFEFTITAEEAGLTVVELVRPSGLPAIVLPLYGGAALPLAPSGLDVGFTASKTVDVDAIAAHVLMRVNALRSAAGLPAVAAHPKLAETATAKADEMAANHYFSHTSPVTGHKVADRAKAAGLTGSVAENLAVEYTAERAWLGWYWSPVHRSLLLDPNWRSHGLGAAIFDAASSQVVFVEHLGTDPVQ